MLHWIKKTTPSLFLTRAETLELSRRVERFEEITGCELVFHFRKKLGDDPVANNEKLFYKLKLHHTHGRRALLITLALAERRFAVWADVGIAEHTGETLWNKLTDQLGHDLAHKSRINALLHTVDTAEDLLKALPPPKHRHQNEISNQPIIEDDE